MHKYRSGIIVTVFLALLGFAYILRNPGVLPWGSSVEKIFPGFEKGKVERVEVGNDVLVKDPSTGSGQGWKMESAGNFPADENKVELVLETTAELEKKELVSRNKENHPRLRVDKGGLRVELKGISKGYELIIGRAGPGFGTTYFRKGGEDEVYLADKSLSVIYSPGEWRDLAVKVKSQKSKVKRIQIRNASGIYELEKEKEKWELTQPKVEDEIVQSRVEDLLSRLTALEAADATTSAELSETGFDKPTVTVKVVGEGGEDELIVGNKNDSEQRFAQLSGNPYIYLLAPSDYGVFEEIDANYFIAEDLPEE